MKVFITGVNGLLGKDVAKDFLQDKSCEVFGIGRAECKNQGIKYSIVNLMEQAVLEKYLQDLKPDLIIHCAAMTKIDECEKEQVVARITNVDVSGVLAKNCSRIIYISSDAVFDGSIGNYHEEDLVTPANFYGYTKYMGEQAVLANNDNSVIIRSSMYGYNINGNVSLTEWAIENIQDKKSLTGFTDVVTNPLYTGQLAEVILRLAKSDFVGILNTGAEDSVSRYDFFKKLATAMQLADSVINPASVESMTFIAKRTKDTTLNIDKMKELLGKTFHVDDGIKQLLVDLAGTKMNRNKIL